MFNGATNFWTFWGELFMKSVACEKLLPVNNGKSFSSRVDMYFFLNLYSSVISESLNDQNSLKNLKHLHLCLYVHLRNRIFQFSEYSWIKTNLFATLKKINIFLNKTFLSLAINNYRKWIKEKLLLHYDWVTFYLTVFCFFVCQWWW